MLRCEWCGREFEAPHVKGPKPKFCRRSHRQRAHEERQTQRRIAAAFTSQKGGLT
jgi:hypothetical protein